MKARSLTLGSVIYDRIQRLQTQMFVVRSLARPPSYLANSRLEGEIDELEDLLLDEDFAAD